MTVMHGLAFYHYFLDETVIDIIIIDSQFFAMEYYPIYNTHALYDDVMHSISIAMEGRFLQSESTTIQIPPRNELIR